MTLQEMQELLKSYEDMEPLTIGELESLLPTMRQKTEALNLEAPFDYALPQEFFDSVCLHTGLAPRGVIWLYDEQARVFGRLYAVDMYGHMVLTLYRIKGELIEAANEAIRQNIKPGIDGDEEVNKWQRRRQRRCEEKA